MVSEPGALKPCKVLPPPPQARVKGRKAKCKPNHQKRSSFFTGNGNYTVTCFKKVISFEVTEHDLWDDMKYRV